MELLASLSPAEKAKKYYDWSFWARDDQLLPPPVMPSGLEWVYWLLLAGRGFGKTRTGAEAVRYWIKQGFTYVNLIGPTSDDVASVMIEGESGLLAICPKDERPRFIANKRLLRWPNGAVSLVFSAQEPDRLRGKQHQKLWADELAAWQYADAWDQALLGLRIGAKPQAVITTTPRPIKVVRELIADPLTALTTGSTYDNKANLAEVFINKVVKRYEGTRLGRQELQAAMLEDTPGALWTREMIDLSIIKKAPCDFQRIIIALDPSVTNSENSDEFGIIVAALGTDNHGYVLEDASENLSVSEWPAKVARLYRVWGADRVVGEVNNGGDMIEATLRMEDPNISFTAVHATRGKVVRAEPIASLYEVNKNMIHHIGSFPKLEDQMAAFTTNFDRAKAGYSPDRVDALVWAFTELIVDDGFNLAAWMKANS